MEKQMIEENGINYTLVEDGMYYPDLKLPKGTDYGIGRYGRMYRDLLESQRKMEYM